MASTLVKKILESDAAQVPDDSGDLFHPSDYLEFILDSDAALRSSLRFETELRRHMFDVGSQFKRELRGNEVFEIEAIYETGAALYVANNKNFHPEKDYVDIHVKFGYRMETDYAHLPVSCKNILFSVLATSNLNSGKTDEVILNYTNNDMLEAVNSTWRTPQAVPAFIANMLWFPKFVNRSMWGVLNSPSLPKMRQALLDFRTRCYSKLDLAYDKTVHDIKKSMTDK